MAIDRIFNVYPSPNLVGGRGYGDFPSKTSVVGIEGVWTAGEVQAAIPGSELQVSWVPHDGRERRQHLSAWGLAIPRGAAHPEAAWRLIEYLSTDLWVQQRIFDAVGWLGGGMNFLEWATRGGGITDEFFLWYLQSIFEADQTVVAWDHILREQANQLYDQARNAALGLREPVRAAFEDANRMLVAQFQEMGLVD